MTNHVQTTMLFRYRRHRDVNDVYTILCQHRLYRCTILLTSSISSTSRCERCIHDIVSTSFTSMYYPVYIVDIVMWKMYTQYSVNIVYIDVLSCLHRRHRDVNGVYTISCQHRLHRYTITISTYHLHCDVDDVNDVNEVWQANDYRVPMLTRCRYDIVNICQQCKRGMTGHRCLHDVDTISSTSQCRRCKRGMTGYQYRHDIVNIAMSTMWTM